VKSSMEWKQLLASITGSVDEELRLRNAYLVAENRILRNQITGRVQLTDAERKTLAEIGQKLGWQALEEVATIAQPDTILAWHRKLAPHPGDSCQPHQSVGRPRLAKELEDLVVRMARENRSWGYDRMVGALTNLGYRISGQTVGNILKRHGVPPAPERKTTTTWREFARVHLDVLMATDFFNHEVWRWCGLVLCALCCFLHGGRCQAQAIGRVLHHQMQWMRSCGLRLLDASAHGPPWVSLAKQLLRSRAIVFGEVTLLHTVTACAPSDAREPCSQDLGKVVLLSAVHPRQIRDGAIRRRQRLDRVRRDDDREAA
jgi:hypothetical protein